MSAGAMAMAATDAAASGPPFSAWVPEVSRFWSAKDDERCPAPRSDDYKDWTLMQLKREITERQLKTNPKKRNKEAFVRILLADDELEAADDAEPETAAPEPQQPAIPPPRQAAPASLAVSAPLPAASTAQPTADVREHEKEREVVGVVSAQELSARQRASSPPAKKRKNSADTTSVPCSSMATDTISNAKESAEYLREKLSLQAARVDIERRRLDMELKREKRNQDLHAVQFALAQEQLAQAKLATQKMKTEWVVDQLLQKKRLRDAGISSEESASLGIF